MVRMRVSFPVCNIPNDGYTPRPRTYMGNTHRMKTETESQVARCIGNSTAAATERSKNFRIVGSKCERDGDNEIHALYNICYM